MIVLELKNDGSMMKFLENFAEKKRQEFLSNCKPEIIALAERGDVTWDEYSNLRMNSFERTLIYPALTNSALITLTLKHILPNCQPSYRSRPITYDEALKDSIVPLLVDRLIESERKTDASVEQEER